MKQVSKALTIKQKKRLKAAGRYAAATAAGPPAFVKDLTGEELQLNLMNMIDILDEIEASMHKHMDTIVPWRPRPL